MKLSSAFRVSGLVAVLLAFAAPRAVAQQEAVAPGASPTHYKISKLTSLDKDYRQRARGVSGSSAKSKEWGVFDVTFLTQPTCISEISITYTVMLQQDKPDDYVMATGVTTTVRDFITMAFKEVGITLKWEGKGIDEKGIDTETGKVLVEIDPRYFRPAEVELLIGDPTKAYKALGWKPKVQLPELVKMMVENDLNLAKKEQYLKEGGFQTENYYE